MEDSFGESNASPPLFSETGSIGRYGSNNDFSISMSSIQSNQPKYTVRTVRTRQQNGSELSRGSIIIIAIFFLIFIIVFGIIVGSFIAQWLKWLNI